MRLVVITMWLAASVHCLGQDSGQQRVRDANAHTWWVYAGDHPVKGNWGVLSEMQIRRTDVAVGWQQLLLRQGVTYRLSPRVQLAGGYGFIRTHRYGDFPVPRAFNEHRFFEQISVKQDVRKVGLDHRFRVEQRKIEAFSGGWRNQNRFRYQLRGAIPLSGANVKRQQWYLFAGNEFFLHLAPNYGANRFDQNRAFAGIGWKVSRNNRVEISYLNQLLVQRSGRVEEFNHTLRIQFTSTAPLFSGAGKSTS